MAKSCRFSVAVHVCTAMAFNEGRPATSEWLAHSVNTNPVVIRRLLLSLAKAGLVRSLRGAAGGSVLARDVEAISLRDIYRAVEDVEGPALHHRPPNAGCPVGAHILPVLSDVIGRAEEALERELAAVTLSDVVEQVRLRAAA